MLKVLEVLAKENTPLSKLTAVPVDGQRRKTITIPVENGLMFHEDLKRKLRTMQAEDFDYQDVILGMKIVYRDQRLYRVNSFTNR